MSLVAELKRRKVPRAAAIYGGSAWILTELVTKLVETYGLEP